MNFKWISSPVVACILFSSCRKGHEKCECSPRPTPTSGEIDSAFYKKSLQLKAIASIHSKPDGAVVSLDGMEIGTTPFDGIKLMSGKHKLEFRASKGNVMLHLDTTIDFGSGHTTLSVELKEWQR
jgi:hypothetical protein